MSKRSVQQSILSFFTPPRKVAPPPDDTKEVNTGPIDPLISREGESSVVELKTKEMEPESKLLRVEIGQPTRDVTVTRSGRRVPRYRIIDSSDEEVSEEGPNTAHKKQGRDSRQVEPKVKKSKRVISDEEFNLDEEEICDVLDNFEKSSSATPILKKPIPSQRESSFTLTPVSKVTPSFKRKFNSLQRTLSESSSSKLQLTNKSFASPRAIKLPKLNSPTPVKKMDSPTEKRFPFLVNILDANKNPPDHPDYDPRTLYIPRSSWESFTPFEVQFWEVKAKHYDTIVFFKKGKFYELYEDDAFIGHQQFDLKLTDRVNMKMVGVPESSFEFWASKFIAKGYKVAKVDQKENLLSKTMRERESGGKKDSKIIQRELSCILTGGTLVDPGLLTSDQSTYCLAIKEEMPSNGLTPKYGVAFVDAATGEFQLCSLADDPSLTQLETLIMQIKPRELVYEKGRLSPKALKLLTDSSDALIVNPLIPDKEFWGATTSRDEITSRDYFGDVATWPEALRHFAPCPLVMSAFGGLVWYLQSLKLDTQLLTLKNIHHFRPMEQSTTMILDGQSLHNLEVLENNSDGSSSGSILSLLNHCVTPFGKRLFRKWLCHPLCSVSGINARLDALEAINCHPTLQGLEQRLKVLPDIERLLSRIHAGSAKIANLIDVIVAFREILVIIDELKTFTPNLSSQLLLEIITGFPDITTQLSFFETAFDHQLALEEGTFVPFNGVEKDYDEINNQIKLIESQLEEYLKNKRKEYRISTLCYKHIGKELYQMEFPTTFKPPATWIKMSSGKNFYRYRTPETSRWVTDLAEAKETRSHVLRSMQSRIYARFDEHYILWMAAVKKVAVLDCLLSLAKSATLMGEPCTRPQLVTVPPDATGLLEIDELRHPCIHTSPGTHFIPNDTYLGGEGPHAHPNIILLTGPNMGGKSTLLRQTCVAIIMAQLGCYVPARRCQLTPFNRIFTRIGANDNILAGQSTFMVELAETAKIIQEATPRSLVILDELGRGTSTFDGYAIAMSVLYYLITRIQCLGLFSTHYGLLTQEFPAHPNVALMHMDCRVNPVRREVTFLYKLTRGVCPKSYGMNVASMAGLPTEIIQRAEQKALEFERQHLPPTVTMPSTVPSKGDDLPLALRADVALLIQYLTSPQKMDPIPLRNVLTHWSRFLHGEGDPHTI